MILGIIALIVSAVGACFTGVMVNYTRKEQNARMRPYVYVDRIDEHLSPEKIYWDIQVKNIGALPALSATILPSLLLDNVSVTLADAESEAPIAIIMPQQLLHNKPEIVGNTKDALLRGDTILRMNVTITYRDIAKQQFQYFADYEYSPKNHSWLMKDGFAN